MDETIVFQTHKSWWAELWLFIVAFIFLAASIGSIFLQNIVIPVISVNLNYALSLILFASFFFFIILALLDHYGTLYAITDKRVIQRIGVLGRYEKSVFYRHVTDVRLRQGLIDRAYGIGTIEVDTAEEGIEMYVTDVENPEKILNIIKDYVGSLE